MTVLDNKWISHHFGITNLGNVCFINSIVQFLFSSPYFNQIIFKDESDNLMRKILRIISKHVIDKPDIVISYKTAQIVCQILKIDYNMQNDMMEFFAKMLELINDKNITNLYKNVYDCFLICKYCSFKKKIADEENLFIQLNNSEIDEEDILKQSIDVDGIKCDKCKSDKMIKKNILSFLPANMIFVHDMNINHIIKNRLCFNLSSGKYCYVLVSITEFFGKNNYGHYTTINQRKMGIFKINDHMIHKVESFESNNIYASLYVLDTIEVY